IGAILRLALLRGFAQPPGFGLGPLPRRDGKLAPQQEVAAVPVGDLLDVAGAAHVLDILHQQDPQFTRPPIWIRNRRGGGLANGFDKRNDQNHGGRRSPYPAHLDPTRSASSSALPRARGGSPPDTLR